ncbi:tetratricopeptide repeat protein [Actinosynnema sp. CS-041913]|uniref:tetratricopeptide repeat protein n=1 Tax=Actinosynnema sp. CS-041913 TaxID=3239917 RepID=UPI003D903537
MAPVDLSAQEVPDTTPEPVPMAVSDTSAQPVPPVTAQSPWQYSAEPTPGITVEMPWQHAMTAPPGFPPEAPEPPPVVERVVDPPAAAFANASLLGAGYLMLGRRRAAILTGLITLALIVVLATAVRSVWLEVVVLLWWAAVIAHGWRLAGGRARTPGPNARRQRLIALATTLPVLLAVGFLRFDAAGIEQDSVDARNGGDCSRSVAAVDRLWFGHHLANAPLTVRGEDTVRACARLDAAEGELRTGLTGDTAAVETGFAGLSAALVELPGYEKVVDRALDGFLSGLPTEDACDTRDITDWLRQRGSQGNALDRAAEVVPRIAPPAMVQCADTLMAASSFIEARAHYQELLDQYPTHELAPKAKEGVQKATWAIELANVRSLLATPSADKPRYCDAPAPYSAAAPYGAQSPNRAWLAGKNEHTNRLPGDWLVDDVANATTVMCAGAVAHGSVVETCTYLYSGTFSGERDVSFHRIAIPVRVYEVKTGKLIADTTVEINGEACPAVVSYTTYSTIDTGPASDMYVTASEGDVHAAFNPLINP